MNQKPATCKGCPLYSASYGFVPDEERPSTVAVLGYMPSKDDVNGRQLIGYAGKGQPLYETVPSKPFIGSSGWLLTNTYLPAAGLTRKDVSLHHVLKCHAPGHLPEDTKVAAEHHCISKHLTISDECQLLITIGEDPWRILQGSDLPLNDWRGFCGPKPLVQGKCQVFCTADLVDLYRDPHLRFITRLDWKKTRSIGSGEYPLPIPQQCIASPSTRGEFIRLLEEALCQPEIMVDTEYIPSKGLLTHVGAAWRVSPSKESMSTPNSKSLKVKGFQLEWVHGSATSVERAIFMRYWPQLCRKVKMGFWNAKADLPILENNLHDIPDQIEDPMQAHAVLWPDMPHDFEFAASIYGKYPKLKHLSKDDILTYHWGDCIDLVWIWEALKEEFQHEKKCEEKYRGQNLKLIPLILKCEKEGIRVNQKKVEEAIPQYETLSRSASILAQAYCGFPINLGSHGQLRGYLGSGESLRLRSMDQDTIATARTKHLPFDADCEDKQGFSIGYVCERVGQGAHPLLELRTMYAKNEKIVSGYLGALSGVRRVYPQINFHTQVAGRHSTTNPALATFPDYLRDTVMPDEGFCWIGFDWDAQEPRIQWGESGSRVLGKAFEQGEDIHTTFVCDLYGWHYPQDRRNPHSSSVDSGWREAYNWGGKDDPRRVFAKQVRYECVPKEGSRMLTRNGWKAWNELNIGEEVLTYNADRKVKEWGNLLDIVENQSEVFELRNRQFSIRATGGHRWFVRQRTKKGYGWKTNPYMQEERVMTTNELNKASNIIENAPLLEDNGTMDGARYDQPKYGTDWVTEVCQMSEREREAFIRGFALADGHYNKRGVWAIDQKDGPLWDAILTACFINHDGHISVSHCPSRNDVKKLIMAQRSHTTMQCIDRVSLGVMPVWCPVTSNGSWILRQGDHITITGNCNYDHTEKAYNAQQKAIRMGISPAIAGQAAQVLLNSDPELRVWFQQIMKEGEKTRITRSWGGGRRVYYWADSFAKLPLNEMRNYPLQAGGADLYNLTIVDVCEKVKEARFVYGMHDSMWFSVPRDLYPVCYPRIRDLVTQPRLINGRMIPFPATFKMMDDTGKVTKL